MTSFGLLACLTSNLTLPSPSWLPLIPYQRLSLLLALRLPFPVCPSAHAVFPPAINSPSILSTCSKTALLLVPPTASLLSTLSSKDQTLSTSSSNAGDKVWRSAREREERGTLRCSESRTAEPLMWCVSRKGICVRLMVVSIAAPTDLASPSRPHSPPS